MDSPHDVFVIGAGPVLRETIQPFPTFSEIYSHALDDLCGPAGQCITAAQSSAIPTRQER